MNESKSRAIIIGAGPAGLTAGLELLRRTDIQPILLESSEEIGGLSRTINYKGNRMDIGGHRFFSKSDRVMQWWMDLMPLVSRDTQEDQTEISYQGQRMKVRVSANSPEEPDLVMLIRPRKSRIYYLQRFFDYPITLTTTTIANLGIVRMAKIGISYVASFFNKIEPERSLEDFFINRFGRELYVTFFKSYTEKVWGMSCDQISAEWGAQRIQKLNLRKALIPKRKQKRDEEDVAQKGTDTSLIERFMYPKFGPGQLWEHVAGKILAGVETSEGVRSGEIHTGWHVVAVHAEGKTLTSVEAENKSGERRSFAGEYFFSTMPMQELVQAIQSPVPENVRKVSEGLQYRDFITVGLLCNRLKVHEPDGGLLKDTWIYVQEPDVLLGRLQIFNNWSPYLVSDPTKIWIGLEYFCYDTDPLWKMADDDLKQFAIAEIAKIGILEADAVLDAHVLRVPKTYPAYFGTYNKFDELRTFTDSFENLFLVGRNGMHKYNNQDHSMLTAMKVVDGLVAGHVDKAELWEINTEQEHHEEKKFR